ncbi:MAG: transposase [Acidobacteria bacterium]|nr:transposase [Acidobacteriota bacterium]
MCSTMRPRPSPGRDSASLAELLGDFEGWLVGDGYGGIRAVAKKAEAAHALRSGIRIAGCWAHVLRKFRDATAESENTAMLFLGCIRKLYAIEQEADAAGITPEAGSPHRAAAAALRADRARHLPARMATGRQVQRFRHHGQGDSLRARPAPRAAAVSRGRPHPDRQQRVRAGHSPGCHRAAELAVHWQHTRRPGCRDGALPG